MKEIRTITLNPSFDLHYTVPDFEAGKENLVTAVEIEAGGKGINTSRALSANGVKNLAYLVVGKENGASFVSQVERDGLTCRVFETEGRIRENLTVHPDHGKETRISLNTFRVPEQVFNTFAAELFAEDLQNLLISFSGRIPKGLEKASVIGMLKKLIAGGAKVVVDSSSFTPDDLREIHPWFIKPNEQEIESFSESVPKDAKEAAGVAKKLVQSGVSETVMISLGGDGAAWSDGKDCYVLHVPKIEHPVSTIGAGDSTIAGLLAGTAEELPIGQTLSLGVAYGTAACMTPGTQPPRPEDVRNVLSRIKIEKV